MRYDPNYVSLLTQSLSSSSAVEQRLTNELSSGLRVTTLSDDAVAASTNVGLSAAISKLDTFVASASTDQSLLQLTDSALGEVVSQITSAISLAVSAGTGTLNAANLSALTKQVSDLRDTVVSLANTSYQGSYVFSGSAGGTKPFTLDSSTTPATVSYAGDDVTRTIATPDGQNVGVNVTGDSVFTGSSGNLLGTLNQLVADLEAGNQTAVATDSSSLTTALGVVSTQRSVIGASLSRLTTASTYASSQGALYQAQQSSLLSADTAAVATGLQTAEVQHEALLGVISSASKTNLFDYLR